MNKKLNPFTGKIDLVGGDNKLDKPSTSNGVYALPAEEGIYFSNDAINWNYMFISDRFFAESITYIHEKELLIACGSNGIHTSFDGGSTWNSQYLTDPDGCIFVAPIYYPETGEIIIINYKKSRIVVSTDGVNWEHRKILTEDRLFYQSLYIDGKIYLMSRDAAKLAVYDGATWKTKKTPRSFNGFTYSPALNMIVGSARGVISYSNDLGDTWNDVVIPGALNLQWIMPKWSDSLNAFAVTGGYGYFITSVDGINWNVQWNNNVTEGLPIQFYLIAGKDKFYTVNSNSGTNYTANVNYAGLSQETMGNSAVFIYKRNFYGFAYMPNLPHFRLKEDYGLIGIPTNADIAKLKEDLEARFTSVESGLFPDYILFPNGIVQNSTYSEQISAIISNNKRHVVLTTANGNQLFTHDVILSDGTILLRWRTSELNQSGSNDEFSDVIYVAIFDTDGLCTSFLKSESNLATTDELKSALNVKRYILPIGETVITDLFFSAKSLKNIQAYNTPQLELESSVNQTTITSDSFSFVNEILPIGEPFTLTVKVTDTNKPVIVEVVYEDN